MALVNLAKNHYDKRGTSEPSCQPIKEKFSPGKFAPPVFDPSRHLFRRRALRPVIIPALKSNLIFIQAQAGQGKSMLAAQFLQHIRARSAWVQIDVKDRDPVVFIAAIFAALIKDFKELHSATIYQAILNGELNGNDPGPIAHMLLKDLVPLIQENYYLVLDDLHLLKKSKNCIRFLQAFRSQLPQGFNLVLLSRFFFNELADNCLCLDNSDLALNRNEVEDLFINVFKIPLSAEIINRLHLTTEGWIMGAVMVKQALADLRGDNISILPEILADCRPNQFRKYFQNELLSFMSVDQRHTLLSLSLLDDIPRDLAISLSLKNNIAGFLDDLVENNFFIRYVMETDYTYYFHHLFKKFLEEHAVAELSRRQQCKVLARAGHWFLRRNRIEQALRYYLRAEAYGMAEKILRRSALNLAATNKVGSLADIISAISHNTVSVYPWLSVSIAYIHFRYDPVKGRIYLEQARNMFIKKKDALGELIATAILIVFHASIDCRFNAGKALLPRAEDLYSKLYHKLSVPARVQAAYAICFGLCHHIGQPNKAFNYITSASNTAQENGLEDAAAGAAIARGIINMMAGTWPGFRQHIERSLALILSPRVSKTNKLILLSQQLTLLGLEGDFVLFTYYRDMLKHVIEDRLLTITVPGHNLLMADINMALAQGKNKYALEIIQFGLASKNIGQSAHIQSLYLAYLAFAFALAKEKKRSEILSLALKSAQLRREAGGPYHEMVTKMLLGGVYTILNVTLKAERFLSEAIMLSEKIGESFIRISAYAHRAFLYLNNDLTKRALNDIRSCLQTMKRNQYVYFYTGYPALMQELLTTAVINDIEKDYAEHLAKIRLSIAITPEGNTIPVMEIITLGDFAVKINGEIKVRHGDFTEAQKELLAMLASAPNFRLSLEIIQVAFWPESPPDKVRSKLDNMLARLRKLLNKHIAPHSANAYISTGKGFLSLRNCIVDAHCFHREVQKGFNYVNLKEFWQAGNAFLKAILLYNGKFVPKVDLQGRAFQFREELQRLFIEGIEQWVGFLSVADRISEAIYFCEKAIEVDPTSNTLVKSLYHLLTRNNESEKAAVIIDNYKNSLAHEGFSAEEINSIIEDFWG